MMMDVDDSSCWQTFNPSTRLTRRDGRQLLGTVLHSSEYSLPPKLNGALSSDVIYPSVCPISMGKNGVFLAYG